MALDSNGNAGLLPHQRRVINYMLRVAPAQKGMLVAHYMGTGKTITALAFLQNCTPEQRASVVIVHPHGLRGIWRSDARRIGVDSEGYRYLAYPEFFKAMDEQPASARMRDSIVVFDEAHVLAQGLEAMAPEAALRSYKEIISARRILLLTGTPIYENELDFRWLVNIAAGHPVLPLVRQEYKRLYYSKSLLRGIVHTWALPFLKWVVPAVLAADVGQWTFKLVPTIRSGFKGNAGAEDKLDGLMKEGAMPIVDKLFSLFGKHHPIDPSLVADLDENLEDFVVRAQKTAAKMDYMDKVGMHKLKMISSPIVIFAFMSLVVWIAKMYEPKEFETLNVAKLMRACGKYVSMHELPSTATDKNAPFPAVTLTNKPASYTSHQMSLWIMLTWKVGRVDDLSHLFPKRLMDGEGASGMVKNLIGGRYVSSPEQWMNYGRVIGNLTIKGVLPQKFYDVYAAMQRVGMARVVIYSNFWEEGGLLFAEFLRLQGVKYALIEPEMGADNVNAALSHFETGKVPVLILHPSLTEGLSVKGARQMHILEPLLSYAKQQQLVARVVRYQSHIMLPLHERNVEIVVWYASVNGFMQFVRRNTTSFKQWLTSQAHVGFFQKTMEFTQDVTPDYMAIQKMDELQVVVESLKHKSYRSFTANAHVPSSTSDPRLKRCCIWEPDADAVSACMVHRRARCVV